MSVYDELAKLDALSPTKSGARKGRKPRGQESSQSTDRSTGRPIDQSTNWPTDVEDLGPVVGKPRAFYVTQKVDRWLDEGVRYLKGKGLHKADRSVLVNSLLHNPGLFKPGFLDQIKRRLLAHLTNRSLRRDQSTD